MAPYDIPVPRSRGYNPPESERKCTVASGEDFYVSDVVLHALIGRMTGANNTTYEFGTIYDPSTKFIEADIPSCYLDYIETITVGPNIQRYMQWIVSLARQPGDETFETVSKNLQSYPFVLNWTGDILTSIIYDLGSGDIITKTLTWVGDKLTKVTLSGDVPTSIDTTKTLSYSGDNLTGVTYA